MLSRILSIGLTMLGAGTVLAQTENSRGAFVGTPVALTLSGSPVGSEAYDCTCLPLCGPPSRSSLTTQEMYTRKAGFDEVTPVAPPLPGVPPLPDFSFGALFASLGPVIPPGFELGSMSAGEDIVPADDLGVLITPPGGGWWAGILFGVRGDTAFDPMLAPALQLETARPDGPGADVFSHVFRGSFLPPDLVAITERAVDSTESGLFFPGGGMRPAASSQIEGLDITIAQYAVPGLASRLPARPTFYFTLTRATVTAIPPIVPPSWWAGSTPSSATVLETTWSPAGGWALPTPSIDLEYGDLGLAPLDEIDGLSVDRDGCKAIFSFRLFAGETPPAGTQLRFVNRCFPGDNVAVYVGDYMATPSIPMVDEIGIGSADVSSLCEVDPLSFAAVSPNQHHFGWIPDRPLLVVPRTLEAQSYRGCVRGSPTDASIDLTVTGWPPGGQDIGFLVLGIPNLMTGLADPLFAIPRCASGPDFGDPQRLSIPLPAPMLLNVGVFVQWFGVSLTNGTIGSSYPLRIIL